MVNEWMKPYFLVPASHKFTYRAFPEPPPEGDSWRAEASMPPSLCPEPLVPTHCLRTRRYTYDMYDKQQPIDSQSEREARQPTSRRVDPIAAAPALYTAKS